MSSHYPSDSSSTISNNIIFVNIHQTRFVIWIGWFSFCKNYYEDEDQLTDGNLPNEKSSSIVLLKVVLTRRSILLLLSSRSILRAGDNACHYSFFLCSYIHYGLLHDWLHSSFLFVLLCVWANCLLRLGHMATSKYSCFFITALFSFFSSANVFMQEERR
jgi:hypothetical protein